MYDYGTMPTQAPRKIFPAALAILAVLVLGSLGWLDHLYSVHPLLQPPGPPSTTPHQHLYYLPLGHLEQQVTRFAMQVVISVSIAAAALFIILSKRYGSTDKHWAYGAIGTVIGFWLRS
jgi:hypothetical protein